MFEVEAVAIGGQNGTMSDTTASTTILKHNCTISGGSEGRRGHVMCTQLQYLKRRK